MPIHDLGYRAWEGRPRSSLGRWYVIAETGIRLTWKSQWLRRMLFVAWLPAIYLGFSLFIYERSFTQSEARRLAPMLLTQLPHSRPVVEAIAADPGGARREVWALILLTLFRYPQGVLMVMLVGLIAPSLIARDMRSRAYLLYFSRPLDCGDYVLGKSAIVWTYLALIAAGPAMALYVLGVFLSPDLSVLADTWDLPLRILAASLWLIIPTTAMALCFSSLTQESRFAAFSWFAVWILGWVAYVNLTVIESQRGGVINMDAIENRWILVSLYHSLGTVQSWVFGLEKDPSLVLPPVVLLLLITVISTFVLRRRVAAPLRM